MIRPLLALLLLASVFIGSNVVHKSGNAEGYVTKIDEGGGSNVIYISPSPSSEGVPYSVSDAQTLGTLQQAKNENKKVIIGYKKDAISSLFGQREGKVTEAVKC